jgi:putative redox protein
VGADDDNANFDKVTVGATVETDAGQAQFLHLVSATERRCPVTQLYKRKGVEFDNVWTSTELPVT